MLAFAVVIVAIFAVVISGAFIIVDIYELDDDFDGE